MLTRSLKKSSQKLRNSKMLTEKEIWKILENSQAILKGHFLLSSGGHSGTYFEKFRILQYPDITQRFCETLNEKFKNELIEVILGLATGGIILGYELARIRGIRAIFTERVEGKMALRRGFQITKGEKVLIVEDVVTTGGSVKETIAIAEDLGAEIIGIAALVDRTGGKINLGYPLKTLVSLEIESFSATLCPLCKKGLPLVKPGSRT